MDMFGRLLDNARQARELAYAPYSRFAVGAAVFTADGRIFSGCNIENASFSMTVCAERTAVFAAVAAGCREFVGLALVADTPEPAMPCGACRQVLTEFAPDLWIITITANLAGRQKLFRLRELLPEAFNNFPSTTRGD